MTGAAQTAFKLSLPAAFLLLAGISFFHYEIPPFLWGFFWISLLGGFSVYVAKKKLLLYVLGRLLEAAAALFCGGQHHIYPSARPARRAV